MARYFEVRIDDANEHHVTRHGVSAREITQVFAMIQTSAATAKHAPVTTSL